MNKVFVSSKNGLYSRALHFQRHSDDPGAEHMICYGTVSILWVRPFLSLFPLLWYNFYQLFVYFRGKPDLINA